MQPFSKKSEGFDFIGQVGQDNDLPKKVGKIVRDILIWVNRLASGSKFADFDREAYSPSVEWI
jgi:hypothetical protein